MPRVMWYCVKSLECPETGWAWAPSSCSSSINSWVTGSSFWIKTGDTITTKCLDTFCLTCIWEQWHHWPSLRCLCSSQDPDQKPGQEAIAETLWTRLSKLLQSRGLMTKEPARNNKNQHSAWDTYLLSYHNFQEWNRIDNRYVSKFLNDKACHLTWYSLLNKMIPRKKYPEMQHLNCRWSLGGVWSIPCLYQV